MTGENNHALQHLAVLIADGQPIPQRVTMPRMEVDLFDYLAGLDFTREPLSRSTKLLLGLGDDANGRDASAAIRSAYARSPSN